MLDFRAGTPSKEQLKAIHKYKVVGSPEYSGEELYVFPTIASDNLLHQNKSKWSERALESMTKTLVGKDFLLNHDWEDSSKIQGLIFDAALITVSDLKPKTKRFLTEDSILPVIDNAILTKEGYQVLILWVAVEANTNIVSDVTYLRQSDLSIGGTAQLDMICPICNISFDNKDCPHYIPDSLSLWLMGIDEDSSLVAPYYIRDGYFQGVELSLVVSGNCPRARILREVDLEQLSLHSFQ